MARFLFVTLPHWLLGCLMLAGVAISFSNVVARYLFGHAIFWAEEVLVFVAIWGVFIGMAAAARRNDHLYLVEITKRLKGPKRTFMESFNRLVVLGVALAMVWFGYKNFLLDMGSYRMPSLIPLSVYTAIVPLSGLLIALFAVEQLVNGWQKGFEGPEDTDDFARVTE